MTRMHVVATMAALVMVGFGTSPLFAATQETADVDAPAAVEDQLALQLQGSEDATGWNDEDELTTDLQESARAISQLTAAMDEFDQATDQAVEFDDDSDPEQPARM